MSRARNASAPDSSALRSAPGISNSTRTTNCRGDGCALTLRNRTRARTGHVGTLDPFATGLLLLLSGRATRLAPAFVGLDKRYLTAVDLSSRTSTGDREGETVERHAPPSRSELDAKLEALNK